MAGQAGRLAVWSPSQIRGSSNGRTAAFGAAHLGSNPSPRTSGGPGTGTMDMKLDKSTSLFFATKIDSKLREGLALSKPGDKKYFDGSSEEFLRIMEIGDEKDKERWIG